MTFYLIYYNIFITDFLSPKPLKTPPPSPAEFKSESLSKQDSEESNVNETLAAGNS